MNILQLQILVTIITAYCYDAFSIVENRDHSILDVGEDLVTTRIGIPTEEDKNEHILNNAQASITMPWKESIDTTQELTFMPFWEYQIDFLKSNLSDLKVLPVSNKDGTQDFSMAESPKGARIANLCLSSNEFRKIRMTYYDAGQQTQVFNSLWYPDPKFNLPILGVDLLQFNGGKKNLVVIDFQPIQGNIDDRQPHENYDQFIKAIRDKYPSLQGKMSDNFYDENQFFSKGMLFSRFDQDSHEIVSKDLWPAYQQSLQAYLKLIQSTEEKEEEQDQVLANQREYDIYSANRDPAIHLLKGKFGNEWATEFVHEFLFDLSC